MHLPALLPQIVLEKAAEVNSIHYYFLVIEGCVVSCIALIFMLVVTTQASEAEVPRAKQRR